MSGAVPRQPRNGMPYSTLLSLVLRSWALPATAPRECPSCEYPWSRLQYEVS